MNKTSLFLVAIFGLMLIVPLVSAAGWTDGGANVYLTNSSAKVGIGTSSPSAKLDVEVSSGGAATIGNNMCNATGDWAVAMGINTIASGDISTAIGGSTLASGTASFASGGYSTATGTYSTAMGYDTSASGWASTAVGILTSASGSYSTAFGREIEAGNNYVFAIGLDDMNGANCNQANSMCIMGGKVGIGTTTPDTELDVNGNVTISGSLKIDGASRAGASTDAGSGGNVLGTGAWTEIVFEDEIYDNLAEYSTATGRFTAKEAGYYSVAWSTLSDSRSFGTSEYFLSAIRIGGSLATSRYGIRDQIVYTDVTYGSSNGAAIIPLAAGEYVSVWVYHNQGGNIYLLNNGGYNYLNVHRLS